VADRVSGAPAWRELPREAQATLVNLMMQLILEHAQRRAVAPGHCRRPPCATALGPKSLNKNSAPRSTEFKG
jgi:hypothetical protein